MAGRPFDRLSLVILALFALVASCEEPRAARLVWASHRTPIGGGWALRTLDAIPESGASNTELWYGERERVATIVHSHRYYGDDCVAYDSSDSGIQRFLFACGLRAPVVLGPESQATWDFEAGALQQRGIENSSTGIDHGNQRLTVEEAKRLAMRQPLRAVQPGRK